MQVHGPDGAEINKQLQPGVLANSKKHRQLDFPKNVAELSTSRFSESRAAEPLRVLEVGAGIGQITAELNRLPAIHRLLAVEPDERFCRQFRIRLPQQELVSGTVTALPPGTNWNAILSINVLEHIKADVQELATSHQLLWTRRGTLCLFVPARPEIYAPLDRDFGHYRRYTKPELHQKLAEAGFEIVRLRYYNIGGYFGWWLNHCLLKKRGFNPIAVRFFDRILFPPIHALESKFCAPPFGQSLLAIARANQ